MATTDRDRHYLSKGRLYEEGLRKAVYWAAAMKAKQCAAAGPGNIRKKHLKPSRSSDISKPITPPSLDARSSRVKKRRERRATPYSSLSRKSSRAGLLPHVATAPTLPNSLVGSMARLKVSGDIATGHAQVHASAHLPLDSITSLLAHSSISGNIPTNHAYADASVGIPSDGFESLIASPHLQHIPPSSQLQQPMPLRLAVVNTPFSYPPFLDAARGSLHARARASSDPYHYHSITSPLNNPSSSSMVDASRTFSTNGQSTHAGQYVDPYHGTESHSALAYASHSPVGFVAAFSHNTESAGTTSFPHY